MLLFTLLVLCGGRELHVAGWECGVPPGQESSIFATTIMFMFWTFKRDCPFPSQKRCRSRCPKHYATTLQTDAVRICVDCTEISTEGHTESFGYFRRKLPTTQKNMVYPCLYVASVLANFRRPLLNNEAQDCPIAGEFTELPGGHTIIGEELDLGDLDDLAGELGA